MRTYVKRKINLSSKSDRDRGINSTRTIEKRVRVYPNEGQVSDGDTH